MSETANVLSFRRHVHPEEITPALRARMSHNIGIDHLIWSGFLAVLTVIVLVGLVLVDTVESVSPRLFWHIGTVITLGLWAELTCFFIFERRKLFVQHFPATTAVVVREQGRDDHAVNDRRALVRYLPKLGPHFDVSLLQNATEAYQAWTSLDGLSDDFEKNLHVGDLVAILYDPARPSRIQIVEFEH
jgi:hypothetical protein